MSTRITPADIDRVAALARLDVAPAEREPLAAQLASILDYAAQVLEIDTAGVPPMSHVAGPGGPAPLRSDEPRPSVPRDEILRAAPGHSAGLFTVPRVIGS